MLEPIDDDSTEIQLMVLQLSPWSKVHIFAAQISLEINLVSKKWAFIEKWDIKRLEFIQSINK